MGILEAYTALSDMGRYRWLIPRRENDLSNFALIKRPIRLFHRYLILNRYNPIYKSAHRKYMVVFLEDSACWFDECMHWTTAEREGDVLVI